MDGKLRAIHVTWIPAIRAGMTRSNTGKELELDHLYNKVKRYRRSGRDFRTNPRGADWHSPEGCRAGQPGVSPEATYGIGWSTSLCSRSRQSLPG
ncbi:hypothetical protein GO003_015480 [Methylicorpusculum oleiharenae]|uniref:hypothetical protein n=1 Tax=Methylicorpusculum oleiharenae TaxID=1338687 RepID=UPI001E476EDC|nr:hypothetical protein [Methylicorpusculum oleiharenae]MCD2451789.1 hypothetical protein [Methylicorpusculum oleiharenae]